MNYIYIANKNLSFKFRSALQLIRKRFKEAFPISNGVKKLSALILILLIMAPTLALCSCCPSASHRSSSDLEISAVDCCCSQSEITQTDPGVLTKSFNLALTGSVLDSQFFIASFLNPVLPRATHARKLDTSPPRFSEIPLYLSNLVLRF